MFVQRTGTQFCIIFWASSGLIDVVIDTASYIFDPSAVISTEDAIMAKRTRTVTYNDAAGELALYIDMIQIGIKQIAPLFPGASIFGPTTVPCLLVGPSYSFISRDDNGNLLLSLPSDTGGLFGTFNSLQLWDHALNASEVARVAASPENLTGNEEGLCILWRADRGHGTRVPNLGSAGATYDAVLGQFAAGAGQTSDIFGSGCDTVSATSPMWVNKTGGLNTPPTADNVTLQVSCLPCL